MAEDSEVVAGEVVFSSDLFQVSSDQMDELIRKMGYSLSCLTSMEEKFLTPNGSFTFSRSSRDSEKLELITGRVHIIWEVENKDEISEALNHMRNLGFI